MSESLLKNYIRLAVRESTQARVPNQLLQPAGDKEEANFEQEDESVNEFCGAGGAMGYVTPTGTEKRKKRHTKKA